MTESSETTPLLTDLEPSAGSGSSAGENERTSNAPPSFANSTAEEEPPPVPDHLQVRMMMLMTSLTWLSIILSVLTFGFALAVTLMDDRYSPPRPHFYMAFQIKNSCIAMTEISAVVAIISSLNLHLLYRYRRPRWLLVNLIVDAIVAFYSFRFCVDGLFYIFAPYGGLNCLSGPTPLPDDEMQACEAFARTVRILARIGLGYGLALGIVHTILFFIRCVLAYRRILRDKTWKFPTGQLSVELSIKFLRQDEVVESHSHSGEGQ